MKKSILMLIVVIVTITVNAQSYLDTISGKYYVIEAQIWEGNWKYDSFKGWLTINDGILKIYKGKNIEDIYSFNPEYIVKGESISSGGEHQIKYTVEAINTKNSKLCSIGYFISLESDEYVVQIGYDKIAEAYFVVKINEEEYNRLQ